MRSGTTLLELLLVLTLAAILAGFGAPRVATTLRAGSLAREAAQLAAALDAARGAALRFGTSATLTLGDDEYRVDVVLAGDTIIAWRATAAGRRGVALAGVGAPLRFGPAGLAVGAANRTFTLRVGPLTRRVVVSRLGRITP